MSWISPSKDEQNGIITNYTLKTTFSNTTFKNVSSRNFIVLTNLRPYHNYSFTVAASTIKGVGPQTEESTFETEEDGELELTSKYRFTLVTLCTLAPGASPTNISSSNVSENSFTINWSPPPESDWNGIIDYYVVNVTQTDNISETMTKETSSTYFTVYGLHPFYNYTYQVAAHTVALGPFSKPQTLITNEASKTFINTCFIHYNVQIYYNMLLYRA